MRQSACASSLLRPELPHRGPGRWWRGIRIRSEGEGQLGPRGAGAPVGVEVLNTQLLVARSAFNWIGGLVPAVPSAEDQQRLQLLDTVIAQLSAAERALCAAGDGAGERLDSCTAGW